ncbi:hypothetical protein IWX90DRAFT_411343 [Phyllosticta citrichinensis]|uniref:Uncharacterized protein n=1 Tax=Phyllosticta citrichinensis TaxID=1130410 RepID=A0ABR1Y893_9PEZI
MLLRSPLPRYMYGRSLSILTLLRLTNAPWLPRQQSKNAASIVNVLHLICINFSSTSDYQPVSTLPSRMEPPHTHPMRHIPNETSQQINYNRRKRTTALTDQMREEWEEQKPRKTTSAQPCCYFTLKKTTTKAGEITTVPAQTQFGRRLNGSKNSPFG